MFRFCCYVHAYFSVPGFTGTNCDTNIDDCPGNLCQNGATCIDGINSYTCHCPPTYTGNIFDIDLKNYNVTLINLLLYSD